MKDEYEVLIVGAGSAGLAALREVRKRTEDFLIVNDGHYGTTCARVGCMPSKALIEAAGAYHRARTAHAFGVGGGEHLTIDVPRVLRRVRHLRDGFVAGTVKATQSLGERSIAGRARLVAPDRVRVGETEIRARRIVLATGSHPVLPDGVEEHARELLTSDSIFELEDLPRRLAVIGMGVIGVELAQACSRLGVEVTGFGSGDRIGGTVDSKIHEKVLSLLRKEFICHLGQRASVERSGDEWIVTAGDARTTVDAVLVAAGRRPNVSDLGLEDLGIELDERGLPPVDTQTLQVADLPIFLAGDANGEEMILHEAADEGHIAGINASEPEVRCFRRRTPLEIVFTDPNLARVGARFDTLDEDEVITSQFDFDRQGRARTAEKNYGTLRLYASADEGRLLGGELCVPDGEHLAHLVALAIDRELTVQDFLRMPFYHPVLEEGLRSCLRGLEKQLPEGDDSDLLSCDDPIDEEDRG